MQDAIQSAITANPRLASAQARIDSAEGQRRQAGLSPNPRLFLQTEDLRPWANSFSFRNNTEDYAYLSQTVESAGKRARRVDVAKSVVYRSQYEEQLLTRHIRAAVSLAYWSASSAALVRDLYKQTLDTFERDVTYSRNRVNEGQLAEADLIRVELERDRVHAQVLNAEREAETALFSLYRAMARTDFALVTLSSPLLPNSMERQPSFLIPELSQALSQRPEIKIAQEAVSQAEANTRLQKANGVPDPDLLFGYKRDVGFNTLYAAVQIPLPLFNRNQGNIATANADLHAAQSDLAYTVASLKAEIESARRAYEAQRQLIQSLPATRARAQESARLAREAYRLGGTDLLRLLDAERTRIDTEVTFFRALEQFQRSVVDLQVASGQPIAPVSSRP